MSIEMVRIRATITIGSLVVSTPYIQSFNVSKSRESFSTFTASIKVSHEDVSGAITGDSVVIAAGVRNSLDTIFTGMVKQASTQACLEDPNYVILNISGSDILSFLNGKKYTRRCRGTASTWVAIKSVDRAGFKSSKFIYKERDMLETTNDALVDSGSNVTTRDITMPSNLVTAPGGWSEDPVVLTINTVD